MRGSTAEEILQFMEGFGRWLRLAYSPSTARTYESIVRAYIDYMGMVPPTEDPMADAEIAIEFIDSYGSSLRSKRVAAYAIKSLYNYLGRPDIAARIPEPRGTGWTPDVIPVPYDLLRKAIGMLKSPRDRAMLCVAYELALRRAEVTLLRRSGFDPSRCTVLVYRVKRPKGVPELQGPMRLSPWCCQLVRDYLASRRDDLDALFVTYTQDGVRPASVYAVWRAFKRLERLMGESGLRLHQLRHTRITELAERTGDVIALARFAGHRNPQSTMVYVHLSAVRAQERLRGRG